MIFLERWTETDPQALPAGGDYDAVRVPKQYGCVALAQMGPRDTSTYIGPIIADSINWYFIVWPGRSAEQWPASVHYCGRGTVVVVPPPQSSAVYSRGLTWIRTVQEAGRRYSDAPRLRAVLAAIDQGLSAPRALAAPRSQQVDVRSVEELSKVLAPPVSQPASRRSRVVA